MTDSPALRIRLTIVPQNPLYAYLQQFTAKQYSGAVLALALQSLHTLYAPCPPGAAPQFLPPAADSAGAHDAQSAVESSPDSATASDTPSPNFGGLAQLAQQLMTDA